MRKLSTPPDAIAITPSTSGPTNADSIQFTVTFDESVLFFDGQSNVLITHSGTASTGVTITGGPSAYIVDVTGISGDGSLTLSVNTGSDVIDRGGNAMATTVTSAAVTIDNTAPVFSALVAVSDSAELGDTVVLSFTSSEPISGDPDVTVNGNPANRLAKASFSYDYSVLSSDPTGPANIEISGLDLAGNPGMLSDSSALFIEDQGTSLPVAAWPLSILLGALGLFAPRRPIFRQLHQEIQGRTPDRFI